MSEKTNCSEIRELFSAMLDGELAGEDRVRLENHLRACTGCRQEFDLWQRITETLRDDAAGEDPSPGFCAGVMGRLQSQRPGRGLISAWRAPAAAAAAAVMLFAGSWGVSVALKGDKPESAVVINQARHGTGTGGGAIAPAGPGNDGQPAGQPAETAGGGAAAPGNAGAGQTPAGPAVIQPTDGTATGPAAAVATAPAPVKQAGGAVLLNKAQGEILSTILKLSVANTQDAANTALALAENAGGGGQVLTSQKKNGGELLIVRMTVPRDAGKGLVAQLSGLGGVLSRVNESRDITDQYNRAAGRLGEIQARLGSDLPADERSQLGAEASGLKRQIESWDEETGSYAIILWLEH